MFFSSIALMLAFEFSFCALPLVAVFVWFAGARELLSVRLRHGQGIFGAPGAAGQASPFGQPLWRSAQDAHEGVEVEVDRDAARETRAPRRPSEGSGSAPRAGFSEPYLRRLENFRGRLGDE